MPGARTVIRKGLIDKEKIDPHDDPFGTERAWTMIPKSGNRFPAFAKPASAGEARSDKIMRKQKDRAPIPIQSERKEL